MHTCDVCATPLEERKQDATITETGKTYWVCSFTCETVVYDELFSATASDQLGYAADHANSPTHT